MLDGKIFLPETGMPIWKIERSSTVLAVWLPEPLTVATWILMSLRILLDFAFAPLGAGVSIVAITLLGSWVHCAEARSRLVLLSFRSTEGPNRRTFVASSRVHIQVYPCAKRKSNGSQVPKKYHVQ